MKRTFAYLFLASVSIPVALAEEIQLLGVWVNNKTQIDTVAISSDSLLLDGNPKFYPPCMTTYTVVSESTSETYPDNTFPIILGRTFKIYKIELAPKKCLGVAKYLQFAIPSHCKRRYTDLILYKDGGGYAAYYNYSKRQ